jgi:hypothetical protein
VEVFCSIASFLAISLSVLEMIGNEFARVFKSKLTTLLGESSPLPKQGGG